MDTKSRNIRYSAWIKLLAVLLCLTGPLAAAWQIRSGITSHYISAHEFCLLAGGSSAFIAGIVWLLYAAGRRPYSEEVHLLPIDSIYLDVGLAVFIVIAAFGSLSIAYLYDMYVNAAFDTPVVVYMLTSLLVMCLSSAVMWYSTSFARWLKRGDMLKHTLIHKISSWMYRTIKSAAGVRSLAVKVTLLLLVYAVSSGIFLLSAVELTHSYTGPLPVLFFAMLYIAVHITALFFAFRKISMLRAILDGMGKIRAGNLTHRVPTVGGEPFNELADNINNIAAGLDAAVESQVKAERMKTELITNVSHDLKTPLTSIITYVDLLKSEGPGSEAAAGYIDVLEAKARRLKALTDDLFEAAKAASGSIRPAIARLDVSELLTQGLGELSDRIRESGLDFRCSLPEQNLTIAADGKLLWRVVENLLSNVFKYALPDSRVYISAARTGGKAVVTIKNISATELNIPAEELMERFTRGDASRHSEGSGLGLAIAKSLVELQGGRFYVEIDGDLFKAGIEFVEANE